MSTTTTTMGLIKPDVNDKKGQTIEDLAANFAILDALYPVGTVYQSTKSTNPSTFIGGTWTALTGRVLIGAGTDYPAGTTGGEATHTLTVEEIPAHTHPLNGSATGGSDAHGAMYGSMTADLTGTSSTGGGKAHNNMPPFRAVYMWERTA